MARSVFLHHVHSDIKGIFEYLSQIGLVFAKSTVMPLKQVLH